MKVTIVFPVGKCQRWIQEICCISDGPHCSSYYSGWKPATLQLFQEGSSYFVEHLLMVASKRIKFFMQSIRGKNKVVISKALISSRSHFDRIGSKCKGNWSKQTFNNYMLKELIEVSFFAIQVNFCFTDTNFTEAQFDKDPSI